MRGRSWSVKAGCAALLACACGGNVNLGERSGAAQPAPVDETNDAPDDPYHVPSERVMPLEPGFSNDTLAVFESYLYFGVIANGRPNGLYRCNKHDCQASMARLPSVAQNLHTLAVYDGRLAVTGGEEELWIGSYALPDATDKQVVIEQLPAWAVLQPLFHRGYVYWPLSVDQSFYRCPLPDCSGGPTVLSTAFGTSSARADGDLVFTVEGGAICRAARLGDEPFERLQPDATLSPAPETIDADDPTQSYATNIATGGGMLYATVQVGASGCPDCQTTFARWPVAGGAREDVLVTSDVVSSFHVFGSELVWLAVRPDDGDRATLSTCRIEACSATLRHLGQVRAELRGIAADAERLYWFQTARIDPGNFSEIALRSVALLPVP